MEAIRDDACGRSRRLERWLPATLCALGALAGACAGQPVPDPPEAGAAAAPESAAPESAVANRVGVFLVELGEPGPGGGIGCGDSLVAVQVELPAEADPLRFALEALLQRGAELAKEQGLYHSLAAAQLEVESLSVVDGTARLTLAGEMRIGGVCDAPRVEAQLGRALTQFPEIVAADIRIGGESLSEYLSGR